MSDDKRPEPKPGEASAQQYVANSNIDAHLIADMLRIESISNEVKAVVSTVEKIAAQSETRDQKLSDQMQKMHADQAKFHAETTSRLDAQEATDADTKEQIKKLEGWFFTLVGIGISGLLTIVVALVSGVV